MAESPDALLTVARCQRRLTLGKNAVGRMLRAPEGDPWHLPSERVSSSGPNAYRVRSADLEQLAARISTPPLPADAIWPHEAIEILAGRPLQRGSKAYGRTWQALARNVARRWLTEYVLVDAACARAGPRPGALGQRRYSRAEVVALRDRLGGAWSRRRVRAAAAARVKRGGLIGTAGAAKLAGVSRRVPARWGREGRYGARKIEGEWFFIKALVETHQRRAVPQPSVTVSCALCGKPLKRSAPAMRRAWAKAADAGRAAPRFFHPDCLKQPDGYALRVSGRKPKRNHRTRAVQVQWDAGVRDRKKTGERMSQVMKKLHKSPERHVALVDKTTQTRWGHSLSDERKSELESQARTRACTDSDRSRAARELEARVISLWPTDRTHEEIADELRTTPRHVRRIAAKHELPPRRRGRPPRKIGPNP